MTTLDKIKLIDFYLHGVDRDLWDFEIPNYDVSLDALRPVIVKLNQSDLRTELSKLNLTMAIYQYIYEGKNFEPVFHAVIDCINYLNEKEK
jgi:hypothetical protein